MATITSLSMTAVHTTGTATTSTELGSFFTYEDEANMTAATDWKNITGKAFSLYVYDSTLGKITLSKGDIVEFKGKNSATANGDMLLLQWDGTKENIVHLNEAVNTYTAQEDSEFYVGAVAVQGATQSFKLQIVRFHPYYAATGKPIEMKAGDTLTWTGSTGGSSSGLDGANGYFENVGNFDETNAFSVDDDCVIVMDTKGNELKVLYDDTDYFMPDEDCVVFLAALSTGVAISYDILPADTLYETVYTGASGILSWIRKPKGRIRFFLDAGNDYMEADSSTSWQGMTYLNMRGLVKVKITSESEVTALKISEC